MFRNLTIIAILLALLVVVLGAYVRLSDAGLGCPDWPGCYGNLIIDEACHKQTKHSRSVLLRHQKPGKK
jgi:cytochrome c oxidase assembly protein subunit 15